MRTFKLFLTAAALSLTFGLAAPHAMAQNAKLTDPQIADIAYNAGVIDVDAAKQALKKAQNAEVRAFAEEMVRDHTSVNEQALALLKKLKVTPEPTAMSKSMTAKADAERTKLAGLSGAAFDKAYIDNEVAYHNAVNGALANTLIPSTTNPQLKSLLQTGLKIFQGHEAHAKTIAAGLNASP